MGKEHICGVSFHLMTLCICPNAPLFIFSPFSLSFPYSFFMLWTQKKQAGLCRPRSVEGCPALWWGNKKKKEKEKSQLTWGGKQGHILNSSFLFFSLGFAHSLTLLHFALYSFIEISQPLGPCTCQFRLHTCFVLSACLGMEENTVKVRGVKISDVAGF